MSPEFWSQALALQAPAAPAYSVPAHSTLGLSTPGPSLPEFSIPTYFGDEPSGPPAPTQAHSAPPYSTQGYSSSAPSGPPASTQRHSNPVYLNPRVQISMPRSLGTDDFGPMAGVGIHSGVPAGQTMLARTGSSRPRKRHWLAAGWALAGSLILGVLVPVGLHLEADYSAVHLTCSTGSSYLASGGASVPAGAPDRAAGAAPQLTSVVEEQVISSTWDPFAAALAACDTASMAKYASTGVQEAVAGQFADGDRPWPAAYSQISFSAPPQQSYPISFLAEIVGKGSAGASLAKEVVFTQPSATAQWSIAFLAASSGTTPLFGNTGQELSSGPSMVPPDLAGAPQDLMSFYGSMSRSGTEPGLPAGFVQNQLVQQFVAASLAAYKERTQNGLVSDDIEGLAGTSQLFAVPGGALVCSAVDLIEGDQTADGSPIVQPQSRSVWGDELAPGSYLSVRLLDVSENCFEANPAGALVYAGTLGGTYGITGVPS